MSARGATGPPTPLMMGWPTTACPRLLPWPPTGPPSFFNHLRRRLQHIAQTNARVLGCTSSRINSNVSAISPTGVASTIGLAGSHAACRFPRLAAPRCSCVPTGTPPAPCRGRQFLPAQQIAAVQGPGSRRASLGRGCVIIGFAISCRSFHRPTASGPGGAQRRLGQKVRCHKVQVPSEHLKCLLPHSYLDGGQSANR